MPTNLCRVAKFRWNRWRDGGKRVFGKEDNNNVCLLCIVCLPSLANKRRVTIKNSTQNIMVVAVLRRGRPWQIFSFKRCCFYFFSRCLSVKIPFELGLVIERPLGYFVLPLTVVEVFRHITETNICALIVSILSIAFLVTIKVNLSIRENVYFVTKPNNTIMQYQ